MLSRLTCFPILGLQVEKRPFGLYYPSSRVNNPQKIQVLETEVLTLNIIFSF